MLGMEPTLKKSYIQIFDCREGVGGERGVGTVFKGQMYFTFLLELQLRIFDANSIGVFFLTQDFPFHIVVG